MDKEGSEDELRLIADHATHLITNCFGGTIESVAKIQGLTSGQRVALSYATGEGFLMLLLQGVAGRNKEEAHQLLKETYWRIFKAIEKEEPRDDTK